MFFNDLTNEQRQRLIDVQQRAEALRRHRQLAGPEAAALTSHERQCSRVQARAAIPLISAHISNARALATRDWLAVTWSRRRWKRLLIWSWAERKRCACRGDVKRFICRSRRRVGWFEFSARLFRPLCWRCSTLGITSRLAAPQLGSLSVIMTHGARHCRFSSLPSRRLAARLSRRLCTSTSSTIPV